MKQKTIKKLTLRFLSDPGHGWLKVNRKVIQTLGQFDISGYSYQRGPWVFLEEDCDAAKVVDALRTQGATVKIQPKAQANKSSKVRSYESFKVSRNDCLQFVKKQLGV